MAVTVNNLSSQSLLHILNNTTMMQNNTLTQMSTGSRINSGKDDPAGLIAMRSLETELTAVDRSLQNNQRTNSMLTVADSALNEVSSLINEIKSLAVASANQDGLSSSEIAANQAQVDEALSAIDQIISTTEFNGKKLLDGSLGVVTTGVDDTKVSDLKVFRRDSDNDTDLTISVDTAAEKAHAAIANASASDDTALHIQGSLGAVTIEIANGEVLADVEAKIDAAKAETGVEAVVSGGSLHVVSTSYGADEFVRVNVVDTNTTDTIYGAASDDGVDAVVSVNGTQAAVDGLNVNFSANGVALSFDITEGWNDGTVTGSEVFTVKAEGGATFQLGTTSATRQSIGIDGLFTHQLGAWSKGYLSSLKGGGDYDLVSDAATAAEIASAASDMIAKVQGRLGGFQKFQVETAISQQETAKESLSSALSTIKDVDYAKASAEMNRQNVLMQSAMSLLGMANQQPMQVLSLLR